MAIKHTTDKWTVVHAMTNQWLKDKTIYCGCCDSNYNKAFFPCCEEPVLGTNWDHCKAIIDGIKDAKKDHINAYASNKKKDFRSTVKLPNRLYQFLNNHFKKHGEKLFKNHKEVMAFAKRFKQFQVPEKM